MPILQENRRSQVHDVSASSPEHQQRRRMLIALVVLLLALVLVLVKDRQLLFPSTADNTSSDATTEDAEPETTPTPAPVTVQKAPPLPAPAKKTTEKSQKKGRTRAERKPIVANLSPDPQPNNAPIVVAATRAMLPPLEVEVVAGNQRHTIDAGSNSVNVKMQDALPPQIPGTEAAEAASSEHVQLAPGTAEMLSHPVDPSYPLLAKQMKVQGAVILEALISKTGSIQDIQVLSGPAILSEAAREAVRQWRFKPYLQSGQPVDSEARITVNFTISTY
jgi:protein TonB